MSRNLITKLFTRLSKEAGRVGHKGTLGEVVFVLVIFLLILNSASATVTYGNATLNDGEGVDFDTSTVQTVAPVEFLVPASPPPPNKFTMEAGGEIDDKGEIDLYSILNATPVSSNTSVEAFQNHTYVFKTNDITYGKFKVTGLSSGSYVNITWFYQDDGTPYFDKVHNLNTGQNYSTIQAAINAASTGDTIQVDAGTYAENVDVDKALNIVGAGIGATIVQASNTNDHVFNITDVNSVNISGLTATGATSKYGIYLYNSNYSKVENVNASNNAYGIYLSLSSSNTIYNNTAEFNSNTGIYLISGSNNNTIDSNIVRFNFPAPESGIHIESSNYNTIVNNDASNNDYGIYLDTSDYTNIANNNVSSNTNYGIYLTSSNYNNLTNNTLYKNSYGYYFSTSSANTISGGSVTNSTNAGIYLTGSSTNTISGVTASYNNLGSGQAGVYFTTNSNSNTFTGNTIDHNPAYGVRIQSSTGNVFDSNQIVHNCGGELGLYMTSANDTVLNNNNISEGTGEGVQIDSSGNVTVSGNTFNNNAGNGLYVSDSSDSVIVNNTIRDNAGNSGIYLTGTSSFVVANNTITGNTYGLYFTSSNNNQIYNNFFKNTNNFYLSSSSNNWNTTNQTGTNIIGGSWIGGNLWAYPNGTGFSETCTNADGICDSNYTLDSNNVDYLPLALTPVHNIDTNEDFTTIQAAINAASTGDTIQVDAGNYTENVDVDKALNIVGAGIGVTIVQAANSSDHIVNVTADSVNIRGFTVTGTTGGYGIYVNGGSNVTIKNIELNNVSTGIYLNNSNVSGFTIANNTINSTGDGIYLYLQKICYNMSGASAIAMGDFIVYNNTITSGGDGVYLDAEYLGAYMYDSSSCTIGDFKINQNTIDSSGDGISIDDLEYFGSYMYNDSSFTMGSIEVNDNTINSSDDGIYLDYFEYIGYYMYDDSSFTMGSIEFNDNAIDSGSEGIYLHYIEDFGSYMYNDSSFTMGSIEVNDNTINSSDDGIYLYEITYFGYYMYGNSSFTMGSIESDRNVIDSNSYGIYVYWFGEYGEYMYDNSSFIMGNIEFNDNVINSGSDGISLDYPAYDLGYEMYGNSNFTMGSIEVNDNTITSGDDGIYFYNFEYWGYDMHDNSSFEMGSFTVNNNIIDSSDDGIFFDDYFEYIGYEMYGNSSFTMGDVEFNNNTINSSYEGIYTDDYWEDWGSYMYDDSSFTMGNIEFNDNTIDSGNNGIYLYELYDFGYDMNQNASFTMGSIEFNRNTITCGDYGIYEYIEYIGDDLYDSSTFTMGNIEFNYNNITSDSEGMYLDYIYSFAETMEDNSIYTMGDILVKYNNITSGDDGIYVYEFDDLGYDLDDNSNFTMGSIEFSHNTINASSDGIYIEYLSDIGYGMDEYATHRMGDILITDNTITSVDDGIYLYEISIPNGMDDNSSMVMGDFKINDNNITVTGSGNGILFSDSGDYLFGYDLDDNSSFVMGNIEFNRNQISIGGCCGDGMYLDISGMGDSLYGNSTFTMGDFLVTDNTVTNGSKGLYTGELDNATISSNTIRDSKEYGIYLSSSSNSTIYNNFFNNTANFYLSSSNNSWNTTRQVGTNIIGGPWIGGNFWAYPNGTGFGQMCSDAGSDGVCDSNYTLAPVNIDYLPLTDTTPPHLVLITTPDNDQTVLTSSVSFTFRSWDNFSPTLGYSLTIDGAARTSGTATGGTETTAVVSGLSDGSHNWSIKVWDGANNANTSETRNFTVLTQAVTQPIVVSSIPANATGGSGTVNLTDQGVPQEIITQTGVTGYEYLVSTNGTTPAVNISVNISIEPPTEVTDVSGVSGAVAGFYYEINVNDSTWFENVSEIQLRIYYNISTLNLPSGVSESTLRAVRYTNGSWVRLDCGALGGCTATLADDTEVYATGVVTSSQSATPYVWANLSKFSVYGMGGSISTPATVSGVGRSNTPRTYNPIIKAATTLTLTTFKSIFAYFNLEYKQTYAPQLPSGVIQLAPLEEPMSIRLAGSLLSIGEFPDMGKLGVTLAKPVATLTCENVYQCAYEKILSRFEHANTIIIARGDLSVDSLAAVAYAKSLNVPILLTAPDELPEVTLEAVKMLGPADIIIAGGPVAVSEYVETELAKMGNVERIYGSTRYETAVELARTFESPGVIVITTGPAPELDAIITSAVYKAPLLYVGEDVPASVNAYIKENPDAKIIYGSGVSEDVKAQIAALS